MATPSFGRARWAKLPTLFVLENPAKKRKLTMEGDDNGEGDSSSDSSEEGGGTQKIRGEGVGSADNSSVDTFAGSSSSLPLATSLSQMRRECGTSALNAVLLLRRVRSFLFVKAWGEEVPTAGTTALATATATCLTAASVLGSGAWVNLWLERSLKEQLKPLSVVTGAVPPWVRWLPVVAPFLWPQALRLKCLKSMGFGVSRAIVAAQEERYPIAKKLEEVKQAYQLMTPEAMDKAMRLDEQISALQNQKHAASQVSKNTLLNLDHSHRLLGQAFLAFSDVAFLRSGSLEVGDLCLSTWKKRFFFFFRHDCRSTWVCACLHVPKVRMCLNVLHFRWSSNTRRATVQASRRGSTPASRPNSKPKPWPSTCLESPSPHWPPPPSATAKAAATAMAASCNGSMRC